MYLIIYLSCRLDAELEMGEGELGLAGHNILFQKAN